jgi:hypothetical protein
MNKLLFTCVLAASLHLSAESIGKITYNLPKSASDWKITDEKQNEHLHTILYTPNGTSQTESSEFFVLLSTDQTSSSTKQDLIKKEIEKNFPGFDVIVNVVKENPNDVLYEWSLSKGDQKMSGISRGFNTNPGTAVLTYQIIGSMPDAKHADWLEALSQAK